MGIVLAATFGLAIGPACQVKNEGEQLFRWMEEKLLAAKSLSLTYVATLKGGGEARGEVLLMKDNKVSAFSKAKGFKNWLVSDGKNQKTGPSAIAEPVRPNLGTQTVGCLLRLNPYEAFDSGNFPGMLGEAWDIAKEISLTDFAIDRSQDGTGTVRCVTFRYSYHYHKGEFRGFVRFWIDGVSFLPVRREIIPSLGGSPVKRESFESVELDGDIDPGKFDLPADGSK